LSSTSKIISGIPSYWRCRIGIVRRIVSYAINPMRRKSIGIRDRLCSNQIKLYYASNRYTSGPRT
jgi:hypothetical protein